MFISKLLLGTDIKYDKDLYINNITCNSKEVKPGNLFIAIKGYKEDGHKYIGEAIKNGASAILVSNNCYYKDILVLRTNDTRKVLSKIASNYYDNPSKDFYLIGITGTKGKTTTSFMIKNILVKSGYKVGLIGTIGIYINNKLIEESINTTPDSINLQRIFRIMSNKKCNYVVMEVSSIALKQGRVDNTYFDIGVFTNFSLDHISKNEHSNIKDYFKSKLKLLDISKIGVINKDDDYLKKIRFKYIAYSLDDCFNIKNNSYETVIYNKKELIKLSIPGIYSVYNSLCAVTISIILGIKTKYIKQGLKELSVMGRNEIVKNKLGIYIIIDYAHNPSSLENIIKSVNSYKKGNLIIIIGCGGNRDKSKRPIMGEISGRLSNFTIITTDNPRYENKLDIIKDIESGIKNMTNNYKIIVDRRNAIKYAIDIYKKDDIILLTGKGHETYQEINGIKYPFDERKIIKEIINERSMDMKEYIVDENIILMDYLRKTLTKLSKNNIKSLLSKEMVVVNGSVQTKYNYELKKNDKIVIRDTKIKSKKLKHDLNILYEDEDIIVINKPAGLLTIATSKEREFTLYHFVMNYVKEKDKHNKIFIIHRLDKETSGIVVFAKN